MAGSGAVEGFALAAALSSIRLTISVAWCKIIVGAIGGNLIHLQITNGSISWPVRRHPADFSCRRQNWDGLDREVGPVLSEEPLVIECLHDRRGAAHQH